jgi:hypothetical protein
MIPIEIQAASAQYGLQNGGTPVSNYRTGSTSNMSTSSGGGNPMMGSVNTSQQAYDPWSKFRASAGEKLAQTGINGQDPSQFYVDKLRAMSEGNFTPNDPSYQWRFEQGQQALERSLGAKGLLNSGNAAIELQNYGQQAASQEYGAQFDRMLKALAGVGDQYNTTQQRLMAMAGINLDPAQGAKLGIAQQEANTNAQNVANNYEIGMLNARRATSGGGMLESYAMAQNNAKEDALESSLWFGREGGLRDTSMMWGFNGSNY